MLRWLRRLAAPVVAIALLGVATAARANSIQFSTTGAFTSSASNVATYGDVLVTFNSATGNVNSPAGVSLGNFVATGGTATVNNVSDSFVLTITQTAPPGGPGNLSANVNGTIALNAGVLTVHFTSPNVTLGSVTYTLVGQDVLVPVPTVGHAASVEAVVTVPTPAGNYAGMGLLGLCAVLGVVRHRKLRASLSS